MCVLHHIFVLSHSTIINPFQNSLWVGLYPAGRVVPTTHGPVVQLEGRRLCKPEVGGSNPPRSTPASEAATSSSTTQLLEGLKTPAARQTPCGHFYRKCLKNSTSSIIWIISAKGPPITVPTAAMGPNVAMPTAVAMVML